MIVKACGCGGLAVVAVVGGFEVGMIVVIWSDWNWWLVLKMRDGIGVERDYQEYLKLELVVGF